MKKIIASIFALGLLTGSASAADVHIGVGIGVPAPHRHREQVCSTHFYHHHRVRSCHWIYR